jgi:hypothetical protein
VFERAVELVFISEEHDNKNVTIHESLFQKHNSFSLVGLSSLIKFLQNELPQRMMHFVLLLSIMSWKALDPFTNRSKHGNTLNQAYVLSILAVYSLPFHIYKDDYALFVGIVQYR